MRVQLGICEHANALVIEHIDDTVYDHQLRCTECNVIWEKFTGDCEKLRHETSLSTT